MERTRVGEPALSQNKQARPVDPVFLAPAAKGTPPESKHPIAEHTQTLEVSRYRVVVEVALDDRLKPLSGLGHGIVHALTELLLNLSQLGSHALADRRAPHHEAPPSVLPADVLKPRKSNVSGLPSPLRSRFCSANRPNSIRRVLSGWSSRPNFPSRSRKFSRK
jgi:hypothetical protein